MFIVSDGGIKDLAELGLSSFGALATRVGFATVWLVADVQKLTAGVAATATVEVTVDGCGLLVKGRWWLRGGGRQVRCVWQGRRGSHPWGSDRAGKA